MPDHNPTRGITPELVAEFDRLSSRLARARSKSEAKQILLEMLELVLGADDGEAP